MAQRRPTVRWNESEQRWMAWVRFPDGSRHKVGRVAKGDAEADLDDLLASRAAKQSPDARRERLVTFNEVLDTWTEAGCPNVATNRRRARPKAENTIHTIGYLLDGHVRPKIGNLRVERTPTDTVEQVFRLMAEARYATSTIDHAWVYLNQACLYGLRQGLIKTNPAGDVLLPAARPARKRKSLTIDQVRALLFTAIPADPRPAQWITALLCGLRPGEITGLRWALVDIDSDDPKVVIDERAGIPVSIVKLAWLAISAPWSQVTDRRSSSGRVAMAVRMAASTLSADRPPARWSSSTRRVARSTRVRPRCGRPRPG